MSVRREGEGEDGSPPRPEPGSVKRLAQGLLTAAAGILILAMMVLTVVDVVGRYLFASPVPGAFEATEVMLVLVIFAGLPVVTARGEHVTVRLALDALPARLRTGLEAVWELAVAVLLAGAAWLLYGRGVTLAGYGDTTVLLRIPLAPVAYAMAALAAVAAVVAVVRIVRGHRS